MKDKQQQAEPNKAAKNKPTAPPTPPDADTTSNPTDTQMSGGAMPSIQGANQSRKAEQNDLRK
ncbi:hypothetical protein ACMA1I_01520 [Pontibacter sp. 13R65]|uniref:hypothetical protein n=1 Tax=Pontibacter sp. 13R65 TaxID=3127458 RepID=UPI00301B709C